MRTILLAALVALTVVVTTSTSTARSHHVIALAPVELVADGFRDVAGIVVDAAGNVIVADRRAGTITRIAPDQRRTTLASGLKHPAGLAFDETGRVLVAEEGAGRVVRLESDRRRTTLIAGITAPRWVVVDDAGAVYVADPDTVFAWSVGRGLRVLADDFRTLEGLAFADGALYVAARGRRPGRPTDGTIYRIELRPDGSAGPITAIGSSKRIERPVGIVRDRVGALYVSAKELNIPRRDAEGVIAKLATDGRVSLFASGLEDPHGLAFDVDGNLYVADVDAGRVLRFRAPASPMIDPVAELTRHASVIISGVAGRHAQVMVSSGDGDLMVAAGASGRFEVGVPLVAETRNDLAVVATPFRGEGLTSPAAEVAVTHDGVAPTLTFEAPAAGGFVRATVSVQVQGSDPHGVAAMTVARDGQALAATVVPALPAVAATASVLWDTTGLVDGTQRLVASAIDRAGNVASAQRTVLVDNTAPETSIVSGPAGAVAESTVSLTFTGVDNLSPPSALRFSWRLDGRAWSPFTDETAATLLTLGPGAHRFEVRARDQAGNEDASPAARDFTIGALRVTIIDPPAGAAVAAGQVLVRGTVEGAGAEAGVAVNETVAAVSGGEFVGVVEVLPGPAVLTAVATAPSRATATAIVSVTAVGVVPGEGFLASPASGIAPLAVAFSVSGVADGARVEIDADGNGTVDISGARVEEQPFTFTTPGLYAATAVVTDSSGARRIVRTVVQVFDRGALDVALQAKWSGLKTALRAGDIPRALDHIAARRRADYDAAFVALASRLPAIDAILTDITLVRMRHASAVYEMVRVDGGIVKSFQVRFALGGDGVWRLDSF